MAHFRYEAKDAQGHALKGAIEASDRVGAVALLHKRGVTIIKLDQDKAVAGKRRRSRINFQDLIIFSRQLATMVDSGITLVQCLSILGEQLEKSTLQPIILEIQRDIESGSSFNDAVAKHPSAFSELYVNMVKAGETSGKLDVILDRVASYLEKAASLQRKIRSALVYPAVVISMSLIITIVLLVKVVPTFTNIFATLGGTLPVPTQILIAISDLLSKHLFVFLIVFFGIGFLLKKYIATSRGRYQYDRMLLKLPVVGELNKKIAVAKFSRTLATLTKSGVPILNALDIVGKTAGNKVVEESVRNVCASIKEGESIAEPLSKTKVFPPMVVRMISVGEQTGQLEKMLNKIAEFYEEQVDVAVSGLTSMIEPLVIGFLGLVIGGIVVALFLPIFKITELLGG